MNWGAMSTRARFLTACLAIALLGGCGQGAAPAGDPPLAGSSIGGPFELVDSGGKTVRWSDFDGRYRMVYFGYTYCPDACPFDVQRMMTGFNRFKQEHPALAAEVQPIFISIDPWRDTPSRLPTIAQGWSLAGMAHVLSGDPERVERTLNAWRVPRVRNESTGAIAHPSVVYVIDRNGRIAYVVSGDARTIVAAIRAL